jgi:hypothetical protein
MAQLPTHLLPVADIGSFFGLCESSADIIQGELNAFYRESKKLWLKQAGLRTITASAYGCDWRALAVKICTFNEPAVEPSCEGIKELCMQTAASVTVFPPNASCDEPGALSGSASIPGCSCETTYTLIEPINCSGTQPVRIEN